jgi:mannose/fructose/N-acetylgalactosamine-specific phosphotransferase system component IIB
MILLTRLDDRLIHGQVMAVWVRHLNIDTILVIDDDSADDDFSRKLMHMAMPKGIALTISRVADAAAHIARIAENEARALLLFKDVQSLATVHAAVGLAHINVANLGMQPGRSLLWRSVATSAEELALLRQIESSGAHVYLQMVPSDRKLPLRDA